MMNPGASFIFHVACKHDQVRFTPAGTKLPRRSANQRGVALMELLIAAALAVLLAVWGAGHWMERAEGARSAAAGSWLDEVGSAMFRMLESEFSGLVNPLTPTSQPYTNRYAPAVAELKRAGYLPQAFPQRPPWGGEAVLRIWRQAGCAATDCMVEAIAYVPPAFGANPADLTRPAAALEMLRGRGGAAWPQTPGRIRGATFDVPNPLPDGTRVPVGAAAVYYSLDATRRNQFVRIRDDRDPSLQGDFSVAGKAVVAGGLRAGGRLEAQEYVRLGGSARVGGACQAAGLLARSEDGSGLLLCTNGSWQYGMAGGFGGMYFLHNTYGCQLADQSSGANPMTGRCDCPAGFRAYFINNYKPDETRSQHVSVYACQR